MPSCCGACHIGLKAHKRRFEGNSSRGKRGEGEAKNSLLQGSCSDEFGGWWVQVEFAH